jgi:hypothetical protein
MGPPSLASSIPLFIIQCLHFELSILSLSQNSPDSSNPSQPTKLLKKFFATGRFKRITTFLDILDPEHRTEEDDKLSAVHCVGIPDVTCQRGISQGFFTSRDSEEERGTSDGRFGRAGEGDTLLLFESHSASRPDILQSLRKHPGCDRSVYKMPGTIDTENVDLLLNTGSGLPFR